MKIVKFVQPNCTPCKMVDGYLKASKLVADVELNLRTDEGALEYAQALGIKGTPTLVLFDDAGNVVDQVTGLQQEKIKDLFVKRL
jgi:thioredoxin-related protein